MIISKRRMEKLNKKWWDRIIGDKAPYPKFYHDKGRRSKNLGKARMLNKEENKLEVSYSFRLYDGRYNLKFVEGVIKHEILHCLDYVELGYSDHTDRFKDQLKKWDATLGGRFINNPNRNVWSDDPTLLTIVCKKCGKFISKHPDDEKIKKYLNSRISTCCESKLKVK